VVASILGRKVGEECWNSGMDGQLDAMPASIHLEAVAAIIQLEVEVVATSETAQLQETLPTVSRVLDSYENPVA
jgi:hypothetical protein